MRTPLLARLLALSAAVAASRAAAAPASAAPQRAVPYLWATAPTLPGWELVHEHVWRLKGETGGPKIEAGFREGLSTEEWIHGEAEPTALERRAQRLKEARAGQIDHRGPWTLVEVQSVGEDGAKTETLSAALPAPAGIYAVVYWGREPEYSRRKAEALAFIEGFRRLAPPLRYAPLSVPGKFSLSVPAGTWSTVVGDGDVDARAIAPASPGGAPPGMLSALALGPGPGAAARFLEQTCGGAAARSVGAPSGQWRVAEALNAGRLETPEAPGAGAAPRRSKCAAATIGGRAYGLWWYAPPSAYDYGLPAFDKALSSFRPAP